MATVFCCCASRANGATGSGFLPEVDDQGSVIRGNASQAQRRTGRNGAESPRGFRAGVGTDAKLGFVLRKWDLRAGTSQSRRKTHGKVAAGIAPRDAGADGMPLRHPAQEQV